MSSWNRWTRRTHRWGAFVIALPLLLVIATGLLLQLKKQVSWVQPPSQKGSGTIPAVSWEKILDSAMSVPESEVEDWNGIDRLDVRPGKGIIKIQCKNSWEIQIDAHSGEVLSSTYRRSDLIESLHDGSFFHDAAKLWVFLPNGLALLGLWITGVYLWYLPIRANRAKARRIAERKKP